MLAAALHAGFFAFGSEFSFPGRSLEERALLNLELGGPAREPSGEDTGGRIVLELSRDPLTVGKRAVKTVRQRGVPQQAGAEARCSLQARRERCL